MTDRSQTIFRVIKSPENPFVMMDKRALSDPKLSYKSKGILAYLLSRPDNWNINVSDVVNHSPDGEFAVRAGIKELIAAGYIQRKVERNEKQQIVRWLMEVYEQPIQPAEEQAEQGEQELDRGNLHLGFPDVGNRDINNTDLTKKGNMGASAPARPAAQEINIDKRIAAFPVDCQLGAKLISEIFNLRPPEKPDPGQKGGEYAKWINGLRKLNQITAEYNTPLDAALKATWKRWHNSPFTVAHPGALARTMTSTLAAQTQPDKHPTSIQSALGQALLNFTPRS